MDVRFGRNPHLKADTLETIQRVLTEVNPYAASYKNMHEVERQEQARSEELGVGQRTVTMVFREGGDRRRYNVPTNNDEVAAIFIGNDGAPPGNHDIVVYPRNAPLQNIHYMNHHCDPLMYPLLFPTGQTGWNPGMTHTLEHQTATRQKVTQLQY